MKTVRLREDKKGGRVREGIVERARKRSYSTLLCGKEEEQPSSRNQKKKRFLVRTDVKKEEIRNKWGFS